MAADRYPQFAYSFLDDAVSRHGSKTALEDELGHTITYLELSRRVNQFAHLLRARGIGPEDVVALYLERSINVFVAVYGILKAGAAFCAVDPANPPARTEFILDELDCRLAVTDKTHRRFFDGRGVESVDIDTLDLSMFSDQQLSEIGLQPHNLAYILYTSGSTGRPKGAMISHSSIAASIAGMTRVCDTTSEWRSLWMLNYVFDGSYYDVFAVLGAGGTVCVASKASLVTDMGGCVNRFQCTHLFVTPSISKVLDPMAMPQLRVLVVGGEAPHPGLRDLWAKRVKLINAYGPTECAILVLTKVITPETKQLTALSETTTFAKVTIRALDSTAILPDGEVGELCIEGAQVGRGYLKRPEQTSTAFVSAESGRMYRTGDLGRRLPDGQLELLGRKDDQVKINGYRIEMEEVENAVLLTGLVKACVVVAAMVLGKKQLVACCLFDGTHQADHNMVEDPILPPTRTTHFDDIQSKLDTVPAWMMPTLWIPLSFVPLAPTGKTERKRLITSIEGMDDIKVQEYQACLARRAVMQA